MFLLRFSLGHVFTLFGVAVPARAGAVIDARGGIHPDSYVGIAFSGLHAAEAAEGERGATAVWAAGAGVVWASSGRHNKRTSRERAKVFMTAKSTPDCSTSVLDEG